MAKPQQYVCLDVGEKRIGVAVGDSDVRIAVPSLTVEVTGHELQVLARLVRTEQADMVVVGYPRNQSGETTAQTAYVEAFADQLKTVISVPIVFQDESLTSVLAEQQLQLSKRPYAKSDIDKRAAALILQDYMELV